MDASEFRFDYERFPGFPMQDIRHGPPHGHSILSQSKLLIEMSKRTVKVVLNFVARGSGTPLLDDPALTSSITELEKKQREFEVLLKRDAPGLLGSAEELRKQICASGWALVDQLAKAHGLMGHPSTLDGYHDIFRTIARPAATHYWENIEAKDGNAAFASWFLQGNNPVAVRRTSLAELRSVGIDLSQSQYEDRMPLDTPTAADVDGRLYWVHYPELLPGLVPGRFPLEKYLAMPTVVFAVKHTFPKYEPFVPLLIRESEAGPVTWSEPWNSANVYTWRRAKVVAMAADQAHHSMVSHFPKIHIPLEAIAVVTLSVLEKDHPVRRLLETHLDGTIAFNAVATSSFTGEAGAYRLLWPSTLQSAHQLMARSFSKALTDADLPRDLEQRVVHEADKLPYYPYRDDAIAWWGAIQAFTTGYVNASYATDAEVASDAALAAWREHLSAPHERNGAGLSDVPTLTTRSELAAFLGRLIFMASALHAAVQVPLNSFDVSTPSAPQALWADPMHERLTHVLGPLELASFQLVFFYFGDIVVHRLGEFDTTGLSEPKKNVFTALRKAISNISTLVRSRNKKRQFAYPTLHPTMVSRSVYI